MLPVKKMAAFIALSLMSTALANADTLKERLAKSAQSTSEKISSGKIEANKKSDIKKPDFKNSNVKKDSNNAATTDIIGQALPPTLKIGGFGIYSIGVVSQKIKNNGRQGGYRFANDVSELYFTVTGKTESGIEYLYRLSLETTKDGLSVKNNYIQVNANDVGIGRFGNVVGPEKSMLADAERVAAGAGGFSGGFGDLYNISSGVLKANKLVGDTAEASKIYYLSPEIFDPTEVGSIQLGIAWTPDTTHVGDKGLNINSTKGGGHVPGNNTAIYPNRKLSPFGINNIAFGLAYKKIVDQLVTVHLTGTAITESSRFTEESKTSLEKVKVRNAFSYALGIMLEFSPKDIQYNVAAGYKNNGKSRLPKNNTFTIAGVALPEFYKATSGEAWNFGGNIIWDIYKISAVYQGTSRKTDATGRAKMNVFSLGADIRIVEGATLILEADVISTKTNAAEVARHQAVFSATESGFKQATPSNHGSVVFAAIKIGF